MSNENDNIMQFWPLPHLIGKISIDSSDSDEYESDDEETIVENWEKSNINQSQSTINFDEIEKIQSKENYNLYQQKNSSQKIFQIGNNYSYSYLNEKIENSSKREKSLEFPFGCKKQPEILINKNQKYDEQKHFHNSNEKDTKEKHTELLEKFEPKCTIHQVEKNCFNNKLPKLIIIPKMQSDKLQNHEKMQHNKQSSEIKIERNSYIKELPQLEISTKNNITLLNNDNDILEIN